MKNTQTPAYTLGQLGREERALLPTYRRDGATIWDAASLWPTVSSLMMLGLIYHDQQLDTNSYAFRLTEHGAAVLGELEAQRVDPSAHEQKG